MRETGASARRSLPSSPSRIGDPFVPAAKKVALVADIKQDMERAEVVIGADHSGLDVAAFQALRRALRPADARVRVVKNSLAARAAGDAGRPELAELLKGPSTLTFGYGDPVAPARLLLEHLRAARLDLPIHGGWLEGRVLSPAEVAELAETPPRDELIAQIAGKLQSPVRNLAGLLKATLREFSGLVEARANQLEGPDAAPAAPATE